VAADAGFYSQANGKDLQEMGVKNVSVLNRSTPGVQRRAHQKKRSFKEGQHRRTGCEGRIRVLKRRHGLNQCRYRGQSGMRRWVGLG
jgi:IS5 family transposase